MSLRKVYSFLHYVNPFPYLVRLSKRLVIPGFDGLPLYDVAEFFIRGVTKSSITMRASAISYSMFMALFPAVIFLFTLIAYIPVENFQQALLNSILDLLPDNTYESIRLTVEDIVKRQRGSLLSVGFFLAMIFSTNGIMSLMSAFNSTYHAIETRKLVWQYIISFFIVIVLTLTVIFSVTLIIFGSDLLKYSVGHLTQNSTLIFNILYVTKWLLIVAILFFVISLIFYLAPAKKTRFRFISAGSTLTTALFVLTSVGFNFYINNFSQYNKLYGSIGTLLVVMLWIYINALVLLIGFELNASILQAKLIKDSNDIAV